MSEQATSVGGTNRHTSNGGIATCIGIVAIPLWSSTISLFRSSSEAFGLHLAAAILFSVMGAVSLFITGLPKRGQTALAPFLCAGALFVGYEVCLASALGLATDRRQALELGMLNYLWPCLTVVIATLRQRSRDFFGLIPAMACVFYGISVVLTGHFSFDFNGLISRCVANPPAYAFGIVAPVLWALYSNVVASFKIGNAVVPVFLSATAMVFWSIYAASEPPPASGSYAAIVDVIVLSVLNVLAFLCWNYGIRCGNVIRVAASANFLPIFSTFAAYLLLGVVIEKNFVYGVCLVTVGSWISWMFGRKS